MQHFVLNQNLHFEKRYEKTNSNRKTENHRKNKTHFNKTKDKNKTNKKNLVAHVSVHQRTSDF